MSQQQSAYLCLLKFRAKTGGFFPTHFCKTRISRSRAEYAQIKNTVGTVLCAVRALCTE